MRTTRAICNISDQPATERLAQAVANAEDSIREILVVCYQNGSEITLDDGSVRLSQKQRDEAELWMGEAGYIVHWLD